MSKVISFHYSVADLEGNQIDASDPGKPLTFLTGSGHLIPGLENELLKLAAGDKRRIEVKAEDAYGERDEGLIQKVPRKLMPDGELKVGDLLHTDAAQQTVVVITEVSDAMVTIDANHPLAGKHLVFQVELVETRDATSEELSHGHAHGPGGHHH